MEDTYGTSLFWVWAWPNRHWIWGPPPFQSFLWMSERERERGASTFMTNVSQIEELHNVLLCIDSAQVPIKVGPTFQWSKEFICSASLWMKLQLFGHLPLPVKQAPSSNCPLQLCIFIRWLGPYNEGILGLVYTPFMVGAEVSMAHSLMTRSWALKILLLCPTNKL